jgi:thioredoxin-related protein
MPENRKLYILSNEECTPCEQLEKDLSAEIAAGKVEILQVDSDKALELLERAGAPDKIEFPSALVEDKQGVRICELYSTPDIVVTKCGEKIFVIREPPEPQPPQPNG